MARSELAPEQIIAMLRERKFAYLKARRRGQFVDLSAYRNKVTIDGAASMEGLRSLRPGD